MRLHQVEMETNLETPQVGTTSNSSTERNHKMSATMQQSISQQNFFGQSYYMSSLSNFAKDLAPNVDDDGSGHDAELQLVDKMHNPIAFHVEMIRNIIYFYQALKQPDVSSFV